MYSLLHKRLVVLILLLSAMLKAQVINIETKRFLNDTNGFVGNADFVFNVTQNTQQVVTFSNSLRLQYQKNKSRILFLNDFNFIKAGNTDFVNSGYQHLRYSYKINHRVTFEAFTQTQYNPILKLDFRYLLGAGPRFKILKKENARIYFATLYMYEFDNIKNDVVNLYEHRLSSYISCTFMLFKQVEFVSTTFYQPNLQNINDYRIANDSGLEITINKHINFKSSFNLLFDTFQPIGIPNLVYVFKNGLSLRF